MKLILSGSNGFIGTEVLTQALANPAITSLIALSRKPLTVTHPKLKVVILNDFLTYPPSVLDELAGAEACIWTIGAKSMNIETVQLVTIDYTLAAVNAFSKLTEPGKKFRFVETSGIVVERDTNKSLWLFPEARHLAGSIETKLLDFADNNSSTFEAIIAKPSFVLPKENSVKSILYSPFPSIGVDILASVMLDLALHGIGEGSKDASGQGRIFHNSDLLERGRKVKSRRQEEQ